MAHPAGLEVGERLTHLGLGVHDERTVVSDRGAYRQPAEQEHVERLDPAVGGGHDEMVTRTENDELAFKAGQEYKIAGKDFYKVYLTKPDTTSSSPGNRVLQSDN